MTVDAGAEVISLIVTSERLRTLSLPLQEASKRAVDVLAVSPDLAPEIEQVGARITEALDHVIAAQEVLSARISILRDGT